MHHQGRGITLNCLRQSGFFIVGGSKLVKSVIHSCVQCKRLRGSVGVQKMANLPDDRVSTANPFDFCGMDFFGPFFVKCRRSTVKYYGCIFTCLYSRGVHVEVCHSLSSDSFIMALRRFISIRGPVKRLRCDRGTNFVGASNELKKKWHTWTTGKWGISYSQMTLTSNLSLIHHMLLTLEEYSSDKYDQLGEFLKEYWWNLDLNWIRSHSLPFFRSLLLSWMEGHSPASTSMMSRWNRLHQIIYLLESHG